MKINKIVKALVLAFACVLSVTVWVKQEKVLRIFSGGEVIQEHKIADIDYIEVNDLISTPEDVKADVSSSAITISWSEVEGATYDVYRSPDNVSFTRIAQSLTTTSYTDETPLKGSNYYRIKAIVDGVESGYTTSVTAALPDDGLESGIYLGITGFNRTLYPYPVLYLNQSSIAGFNEFIDGMTTQNGTLLYYGVDQALNTMQAAKLPSDVATVAIITFTDGLDQGSMMKTDIYDSDMNYLNALNKRITEETIAGQRISAYSIGVKGNDVSDIAMFRENLGKLASAPENAIEVSSMSEVNAKFQEIAEKLSQSNYVQTINLNMPGVSDGTKVRFTFDNVKDAENSTLYIEGTFNFKANSLDDIVCKGLTTSSGESVKGTVDDIFVNFTFKGVHTDDNVLIKGDFTDEWKFVTSNSSWQINSEFDRTEDFDIVVQRTSAAIMLILDCSSSLGSQFATAQSNAKGFIKTLYEASGFSTLPDDPDNPDNPDKNDPTIYSTTPFDLSVAIWKDGKRYYLTGEQYKKANLNDATVEGLTVLSNLANFIISPENIREYSTRTVDAMTYYSDLLPDKTQASVISARYLEINSALSSLGWSQFSRSQGDNYLTKTAYPSSSDLNYALYLYSYTGGNLSNAGRGYLRCVQPIDAGEIILNDPRDLTLAVKKGGVRYYISDAIEDLSQFDEIEGVAVFLGDQKFIIELNDKQATSVTKDMAMALYGDILPDADQAKIISLRYREINNALSKFGGKNFLEATYLTKSSYNTSYNYTLNLDSYNSFRGKATLDYWDNGYIRGVKTIEE